MTVGQSDPDSRHHGRGPHYPVRHPPSLKQARVPRADATLSLRDEDAKRLKSAEAAGEAHLDVRDARVVAEVVCAIKIQATIRRWLGRREAHRRRLVARYMGKKAAITRIQKRARGMKARRWYQDQMAALVRVQSLVRRFIARLRVKRLQKEPRKRGSPKRPPSDGTASRPSTPGSPPGSTFGYIERRETATG
jgi:hypothetical protein